MTFSSNTLMQSAAYHEKEAIVFTSDMPQRSPKIINLNSHELVAYQTFPTEGEHNKTNSPRNNNILRHNIAVTLRKAQPYKWSYT